MIADILGVSRNTVIGFCHRRGIKMLGSAVAFQITKKPKNSTVPCTLAADTSALVKAKLQAENSSCAGQGYSEATPRVVYLKSKKPKPEKKPDGRHHKTTVNVNKSCAPLPTETVIDGCKIPFPPAEGRCRSIVGEARELVCCGNPTQPGRSFCDLHNKVYYVETAKKVNIWY